MKLAYSSNAYMRTSIHDAIRRIASLGYHGIELMADKPHLWPEGISKDLVAQVRCELADHGLSIANVNAFMMNAVGDFWHPSWIEPDFAYRQQRVRHTIEALKMASALGAKCITTEPGGPLDENADRGAALDVFIHELREPLRVADGEGVLLLIEPEPGLLIENVNQFLELADRVASPAMGLNFDIGHFFCVKEPLAEAVGRLRNHTRHYHIEDIAASRVHQHMIPGEGAIDFPSVLDAIQTTSYDGWITVELYPYLDDPDGAGRRARVFLSSMIEA